MNEIAAFADRLCLTLLHSLWQATAIVLLASAVVRLSRCRARIAYAAWMTGLLSAVVCMPVTFLRIPPGIAQQRTPAFDSAEAVVPTPEAPGSITAETASRTVPVAAHWRPDGTEKTPAAEILAAANTVPQDSHRQPVEPASSGLSVSASAGLLVLAVYLPGVVLMLLRLCLASVSVGRLARNASIQQDNRVDQIVQSIARQWNLRISPVVAVTQQVIVPHVVGLFRPVILLPASAVTGLSADELTLVLAHEIAHLRRFDLWATMVQRLAEALLFFNPAIWLLSRRVSEFREFCCDDLVCQSVTDSQTRIRVRYAEALLHVVSLSSAGRTDAPNLTAVAASGRSPSELRRRIARLLDEPVSEHVPGGRGLLVAFGACLLCLTLPVMMPRDVATGAGSAASMGGEKPVEKPGQREFRLQVTGPDGKPLPHVHCEIRGIPNIPTADVLVGRHEKDHRYGTILESDESGQLHFWRPVDAQYLNVFVELPGFGPYLAAWRVADGSEGIPDSFTIELEAAWTVTGQVVDASGKPIAGAQVSPQVQFRRRPGDEKEIGTGTHLMTDASGFWRYEMVPVSEETVFVSVDDPRYAQGRLRLPRAEYEAKPDGAPKTIVLVTGLSVTGTVTDETGKPIEDALIRTMYFNELREAKTDQNGKYTLRGCEPRLTRIVCSAPGRARDLQDVEIDPAMAPVNFTMRPGRHVRIRVLDENGAGVARSRIFFQRWRGPIRYFEFNGVDQYADGQGVWEWNEAPLDEFEADICRADGMVLEYQQIRPGVEEYVFRPPGLLVVSGRVTDKETGELVRNFRCVPGGRDEPGQREGENWHLQDTYQAIDGTYTITRHRSAPAHLVRIEADGYKVAVSRDIRDSEGNLELNFELTRTPDIAISFSTPDGQPASEAEVVIGLANE